MSGEAVLIVASGHARFAVERRSVRELTRMTVHGVQTLAMLLGANTADDEPYVLFVADTAPPAAIGVCEAELRSSLPRMGLPTWLAAQAHPAVCGVMLDGSDLIPVVDLARLALQTGRGTP